MSKKPLPSLAEAVAKATIAHHIVLGLTFAVAFVMYIDRAVEPAPERLDVFAKFIREERKLAQQMVKDSGIEPK